MTRAQAIALINDKLAALDDGQVRTVAEVVQSMQADGQLIRLVPMPEPVFGEANARRRGYGMMKGKFEVPGTFFEPLPDDELALWKGQGAK